MYALRGTPQETEYYVCEGLRKAADGFRRESLTEEVETVSPAGRPIFHVFAALAEFERNLTNEEPVAGRTAARTVAVRWPPFCLSHRTVGSDPLCTYLHSEGVDFDLSIVALRSNLNLYLLA